MPMPERANDLKGYTVIDQQGRTVGPITGLWLERGTQRPAFASVRTGVLRGREHVLPIHAARLDEERRRVVVPFSIDRIHDAPSHPVDHALTPDDARAVVAHYREAAPDERPGDATRLPEDVPLHEERVEVGKRVVAAGGVRLRKVVRTRIVHHPVEVRYEEIVVERVGPDEMPAEADRGRLPSEPFAEGELFLRELAEEPLVTKHAEVVGGVRASMRTDTRVEDVSTTVRREDVEVSRERLDPGS